MLKIEIGKWYVMRCGIKVHVDHIYSKGNYPIKGYSDYISGYHSSWEWSLNGTGWIPEHDIIAESQEQSWKCDIQSQIAKSITNTEILPVECWDVDTKILVRDAEDCKWVKRHFAKISYGHIFAWIEGKTSFTTTYSSPWNYVKLEKDR